MMLRDRALTSQLVLDKVSPTRHLLGPYNKLAIAPGLLSGTNTPPSGRLSVGGKSPLTGGIKEINASSLASQKLANLGIKAVILEGKPAGSEWYLAGKGTYEVTAICRERLPLVLPAKCLCLPQRWSTMIAVSYTHLTLPTTTLCRSRWSPYH